MKKLAGRKNFYELGTGLLKVAGSNRNFIACTPISSRPANFSRPLKANIFSNLTAMRTSYSLYPQDKLRIASIKKIVIN